MVPFLLAPLSSLQLQYTVSYWGSDPHSLGSYTFDRVGVHPSVFNCLRAPAPPLFFAGEGTSRLYSGEIIS